MTTITKSELLAFVFNQLKMTSFSKDQRFEAYHFESVLKAVRFTHKVKIPRQLILDLTSDFESIAKMRIATGQAFKGNKVEALKIINLILLETLKRAGAKRSLTNDNT